MIQFVTSVSLILVVSQGKQNDLLVHPNCLKTIYVYFLFRKCFYIDSFLFLLLFIGVNHG